MSCRIISVAKSLQITQLKIDNNPYARAFRESIPSDSPEAPPRVGGHAKRIKSVSGVVSHFTTHSLSLSPSIANGASSPKSTCNSLTSVESGREGGEA